MDTPAAPPYGDLFERARKSRRITIQRAAASAGIVKQTWIDIVKGRTARPKADTLAAMALAVGVPPDRLEAQGHQGEAAEILREMLRESPDRPAVDSRVARPRPALVPPPVTEGTPAEIERDRLLAEYPDDEVLRMISRGHGVKTSQVVMEMLDWLGSQGPWAPPQENNGTAGLTAPEEAVKV